MKLFYRIDDFGHRSGRAEKLIEALERLSQPYILSVVPKWLDDHSARLIKRLRNAIVFQHGYEHRNRSSTGIKDEFPEALGTDQAELQLSLGKRLLERALARPIIGYVPPFNFTSQNAIRALEKLGFVLLSAHERTKYRTTLLQPHIAIDPITWANPARFRSETEIENEILRRIKQGLPLTGIVAHPDMLTEEAFGEFLRMVEKLQRFGIGEQSCNRMLKFNPYLWSR